jgi:peptidylprolyl isomerase
VRSKVAALASAASILLVLALAGCGGASPSASPSAGAGDASASASASATPAPTAHPTIAPIATIDGVAVTGAFGADPTVTFTAPFAIDQTRSKVLIAGKGAAVAATNLVDVNYHGVNAYTGQVFDNSWTRGSTVQFSLDGVVAGFKTGLVGKHVGDRVLLVVPGKDGYDANGGSGDGSILVGDTLVFVVDILDIDYQKPVGTAVTPAAGLPTVTDANGVPTVTINTAAAAPTATVVQPLIAGSGTHKILATDAIMDHYRMYSWKTGALLDDKFSAYDSGKLADAIGCWKDGLVGQALGSRLLLICPPASGFPEGNPTPAVTKGDTVVFVIDLMFAAPTS